jgi:hypothetical protein
MPYINVIWYVLLFSEILKNVHIREIKNDVEKQTYIYFAFIDKGYTCSSDLNPRLGENDTARVKV